MENKEIRKEEKNCEDEYQTIEALKKELAETKRELEEQRAFYHGVFSLHIKYGFKIDLDEGIITKFFTATNANNPIVELGVTAPMDYDKYSQLVIKHYDPQTEQEELRMCWSTEGLRRLYNAGLHWTELEMFSPVSKRYTRQEYLMGVDAKTGHIVVDVYGMISPKSQENRHLQKMHQKMTLEFMEKFSDSAVVVYLDSGKYHLLSQTNFKEAISEDYGEACEYIAKEKVLPECREAFMQKTDIDVLRDIFRKSDKYVFHTFYKEEKYQISRKTYWYYALNERKNTVLAVVQDSTEAYRREKALEDAFEMARSADNAKTDFLSRMSHDIRTPMNAIMGMTALAQANIDDTERVADALDKIASSSRHLLSLVNEVLDMNKIESGKLELSEEPFNFADLISNMITMVKPQIDEHEHRLDVQIGKLEHENVIGDSLRVQQAFVNIMSNAVKYTPNGGLIRVHIAEIQVKNQFACYEFIFQDNGIGISEEFQSKIFHPFSREEDDRINKIQGTGLGMAITRNVVRMMGGDIKVESKVNVGTKFTVTMWFRVQEQQECLPENIRNLKVLVIDGIQESRDANYDMLTDLGFDTTVANSGEGALRTILEREVEGMRFDVIFFNWKTDDVDSIEFVKEMRKHIGTKPVIIVYDGYEKVNFETEARTAGVDTFIQQPIFRSRLRNIIKQQFAGEEEVQSEVETLLKIGENDFSSKNILIVEDNEINREIAVEIVSLSGAKIETAENGKRAVDMVEQSEEFHYDLILMDIQMPIMNGYEATTAIRSLQRGDVKHIPIVAMTANAFVEDVNSSKAAGMNEHLAKPIDYGKLNELLIHYLG